MILQIDSELCYHLKGKRPVDLQNTCVYLDAAYLGLFFFPT